ncbi:MAG: VWA domain-containing protein, partial [Planctomycetota bacterium]|nr:VWA domain-containing protein [Planctomycetota bacterium]
GGPGGILDGTSPGFGKLVGNLRGTGLDLVLVVDATDSMTPYIEQAKARLREVLNVVTGLVPNARVGVVAYKDYGDDYGPTACRLMGLTDNHQAVRKFIDETIAGGGGDIPEPIHEALAAATSAKQMGWNLRRKHVIILVGDSPCHSSGRAAAYSLAAAFAKDGGVINVIDTGGTGAAGQARTALQPDLQRIARDGGGSAFLLTDEPAFWRYLIVSVFGERYERDVNVIIEKFAKKE